MMTREDVGILIVDDVNSTRTQIRDLLRESGFRKISLAANGEEAKVALETTPFQMVLCDWYMTPTNGIEVLKYIRSHPKLSGLGFIMVTAESTKDKVIEAIQSGVDDYIVKPLTLAQIQSKVFGVLLRKKVI